MKEHLHIPFPYEHWSCRFLFFCPYMNPSI